MNITVLFPATTIALSIGAAVVYAVAGDVRRVIYWIAAAILTASVTF